MVFIFTLYLVYAVTLDDLHIEQIQRLSLPLNQLHTHILPKTKRHGIQTLSQFALCIPSAGIQYTSSCITSCLPFINPQQFSSVISARGPYPSDAGSTSGSPAVTESPRGPRSAAT